MKRFIIRLDDASEYRDIEQWNIIEELLDKYDIKPLVGVIPNNMDKTMTDVYARDDNFWDKVHAWQNKGWVIAMHGYNHVYSTACGGINPVNKRSEFAGLSLLEQKEKISKGIAIMRSHDIDPKVFFAPSHTFDKNTVEALKSESNIRIISDTIANKPYQKYGITFVPQQSGHVRNLPLDTITFCYHPNTMLENDFVNLEKFIKKYRKYNIDFPIEYVIRKLNLIDKLLSFLYFLRK